MLYLEKSGIYMLFQDDVPSKKALKAVKTFYILQCLKHLKFKTFFIQGLVLVILKELPIGELQTILFFAKVNQNYQHISTQHSDPSGVHSGGKMQSLSWNSQQAFLKLKMPAVSSTVKTKSHLLPDLTVKDRAEKVPSKLTIG